MHHKVRHYISAYICGLAIIMSISCSGSKTSGAQDEMLNEDGQTISFYNELLEFSESSERPLKKIESNLKASIEWIGNEFRMGGRPMWNLAMTDSGAYKIERSDLSAPEFFSAENKKALNDSIALIKNNFKKLQDIASDLAIYYESEDYKDDAYKKLKAYEPELVKLVSEVRSAAEACTALTMPLADAAERKSLAGEEVGIFILNMRDIMDTAETQYAILATEELLYKSRSGLTPDAEKKRLAAEHAKYADEVETVSKQLDEMAAKHRGVDFAPLENIDSDLINQYKKFYARYDAYKGAVRKAVRDMRTAGVHDSISDIKHEYDMLISEHNDFIEKLNRQ